MVRRRLALATVSLLAAGLVAVAVHESPERTTIVAADIDGDGDGRSRPIPSTSTSTSIAVIDPPTTTTEVVDLSPTTTALPAVNRPPRTVPLVTVPTVTVPTATVPRQSISLAKPVDAVDGPGLYLVDVDGRNLRRLIGGRAAFPAWSPDGTRLAYTLDDALHVTGLDGRSTLVSREAVLSRFGPTWSPDGQRVAFPGTGSGPGDRDAWTVATDGTSPQRLPHAGDDAAVALGPGDQLATMGTDGLFVTDVAGSAWRRLGDGTYNFGQLRWSPDGKRLATVPDSMAADRVIDVATGATVQVGGDEPHRTDSATWCPDGQHLVIEGYFRNQQVFGTWLAPVAGGPPTLLAANEGDADCHNDALVVAVQQGNNRGRPWALVALRTDGSDRRTILTYGGNEGYRSLGHPQASPDGRTIAFVALR